MTHFNGVCVYASCCTVCTVVYRIYLFFLEFLPKLYTVQYAMNKQHTVCCYCCAFVSRSPLSESMLEYSLRQIFTQRLLSCKSFTQIHSLFAYSHFSDKAYSRCVCLCVVYSVQCYLNWNKFWWCTTTVWHAKHHKITGMSNRTFWTLLLELVCKSMCGQRKWNGRDNCCPTLLNK